MALAMMGTGEESYGGCDLNVLHLIVAHAIVVDCKALDRKGGWMDGAASEFASSVYHGIELSARFPRMIRMSKIGETVSTRRHSRSRSRRKFGPFDREPGIICVGALEPDWESIAHSRRLFPGADNPACARMRRYEGRRTRYAVSRLDGRTAAA